MRLQLEEKSTKQQIDDILKKDIAKIANGQEAQKKIEKKAE